MAWVYLARLLAVLETVVTDVVVFLCAPALPLLRRIVAFLANAPGDGTGLAAALADENGVLHIDRPGGDTVYSSTNSRNESLCSAKLLVQTGPDGHTN